MISLSHTILSYMFGVTITVELIYLLWVITSPHKDTSLRLIFNILLSAGVFCPALTFFNTALVALVFRFIIFTINLTIYFLLRRIKYYS